MEEGGNAPDLMLIIEKGPRNGESIQCHAGSTVGIGRIIKGNTVTIKDRSISQNHLLIKSNGLQWFISDLNTFNGTFLNDFQLPPISPHPLNHADTIKIGYTTSITVRIIDRTTPQRNTRRGRLKKVKTENVPEQQMKSVEPKLEIAPRRRNPRRRATGAADSEDVPLSCEGLENAGKVHEKMPVNDNVGVWAETGAIGVQIEEKTESEVAPPLRNLRSRAHPTRVTQVASKSKGVSQRSKNAAKVDEKMPLRDNAGAGAEVPSNVVNVKEEIDSEIFSLPQNSRSQAALVETKVSSGNNLQSERCREKENPAVVGGNLAGREDVGVDKKKELGNMTLGEWFDWMEKYLPQQVNEAAEEIIVRLKQRQKQFEEFLIEQQCNVKGKIPITD